MGAASGTGRVSVSDYQAFRFGNLVFVSALLNILAGINTTTTLMGISYNNNTLVFKKVLWSSFAFNGDAIGSPSVRLDSTGKYLTQQASGAIDSGGISIMAILELNV